MCKSHVEASNLGRNRVPNGRDMRGALLIFGLKLTGPTLQLDQDKLPAIEDILLSHLPASTLVAESLWIVCSILADISNMSY